MPPADLLAGLKAEDVGVTLEPNIGEHGPRSASSRPGSNRWPIWVERIEPNALKQAAVVTATVLYQAAMRDQKMPR